jgi:hypothetical protein
MWRLWEPLDVSKNVVPTARYSYAAIYLHLSVFMLIPGLFLLFSLGYLCTFNLGLVRSSSQS